MSEVVADTHAILWYLSEPEQLSADATVALDEASASGIYVSTISLVEIVYLIEKGRFEVKTLNDLVELIADPDLRIFLAPVSGGIASAVARVPRKLVPDMPDRIIAATAVHLGLPLVTADFMIRSSGIATIW